MLNVIAQKLEYAVRNMGREREVGKQLETVQTAAAKKVLGCCTKSRIGKVPTLKTKRDVRKLKWHYEARTCQIRGYQP